MSLATMRLIVPLQGVGLPCTMSRRAPSLRSIIAAVSGRAVAVLQSGEAPYFVGSRRSRLDRYHHVKNPNGVIELALAENQLCLDIVGEWVHKHLKNLLMDGELSIREFATYQPYDGLLELKTAMAGLMQQVMQTSLPFNPSQIVFTSGATPAVEILGFCLADPGDAFLVPSPYYNGYDRNLRWRSGVELIPVPCFARNGFRLSISELGRAYNQARKIGIKVRAILLSNPSNPVGSILPRESIHELLDFAVDKNIHVVSDEVFAGSVHGDDEFVSMAEVVCSSDCDKSLVHILYGLSKDLSLPGFLVGVIYSYNEKVTAAAKLMSRFSSVSVPTQRLLVSMLSDSKFIEEYMQVNKHRLHRMYRMFVDGFKELDVRCVKSSGGFYCWVDMSRFMRSNCEKGELELWEKMLNVAKIRVVRGRECHCLEPGWFRFCFATLTENDIPVVMERIKRIITS